MTADERAMGVEWVGGLVTLPAYVTGEGEPYRPELLLWLGAQGAVLGTEIAKPGELLSAAGARLRSTIEAPLVGPAHAPSRVRVASAQLARQLRVAYPAIEIVCAPTPEIDAAVAMMRARFDAQAQAAHSYLAGAIKPQVAEAFFRATAELFTTKPWEVVPSDQNLFAVTIPELGLHDAVVSIIGQLGQSRGLVLFWGIDDFKRYVDVANVLARGEEPRLPRHVSLHFEIGSELPPRVRQEIAEHGWHVADAAAYPWLTTLDEDLVVQPHTARELRIVEALALALTRLFSEDGAVRAACLGEAPIARTLPIETHAGEIEVTLRVPYARSQ